MVIWQYLSRGTQCSTESRLVIPWWQVRRSYWATAVSFWGLVGNTFIRQRNARLFQHTSTRRAQLGSLAGFAALVCGRSILPVRTPHHAFQTSYCTRLIQGNSQLGGLHTSNCSPIRVVSFLLRKPLVGGGNSFFPSRLRVFVLALSYSLRRELHCVHSYQRAAHLPHQGCCIGCHFASPSSFTPNAVAQAAPTPNRWPASICASVIGACWSIPSARLIGWPVGLLAPW